jgi:hypothetical protein
MNWLDELGALRPEHRLIFNDFYTNEELQCSILLSGVTFAPHKCKAVVSVRVGVAAAALVDLFERHYGNQAELLLERLLFVECDFFGRQVHLAVTPSGLGGGDTIAGNV